MKTLILTTFLFLGISISINAQDNLKVDSDEQFINYLENQLGNETVNDKTIKEFHEKSRVYWHEHKLDYNVNPEKYNEAIGLFYKNKQKFKRNNSRDLHRYKDAIINFHRFDQRNTLAKNPVLFIGSSSIAGWETSISFPDLPIINRGLGGISIPEIVHYYDDILKKYAPMILVVYCDIDVESGKSPNQAVSAFKTLVNKVKTDFPQTQILLMSMKPTLIDDFLGKDVRKNKMITNKQLLEYAMHEKNTHFIDITSSMLNPEGSLRSDIFLSDGMHLNNLGYALWNPIVRKQIQSLRKQE